MPTNINRKVVFDEQLGAFRFVYYDTGAAYLNWQDRDKLALSITQSRELLESGHLKKLLLLLDNEETSSLAGFFPAGIRLEFSQPKYEAVCTILDSNLSDSAKLSYVISYLAHKVKLSDEILQEIFTKRPEPFLELTSTFGVTVTSTAIRNSIFPGYFAPNEPITNEEEYGQFSTLAAFLASQVPVTYGQFVELHKGENFIPHRHSGVGTEVFKPMGAHYVSDLYPREYVRFATYFGGVVSGELRKWARARFDAGIETFKEAQDRRGVKFEGNKTNHLWYETIKLLTVEEADRFQRLLEEKNGLNSILGGADKTAASIFAYYFVVGGEEKLKEFALHVRENFTGMFSPWGPPQVNLKWHNPFSVQVGKTVRLAPYVQALEQESFDEYPLEWLLASL